MSNPIRSCDSPSSNEISPASQPGGRISVPEIARRLDIGRLAVYAMLDQGTIPAIRLGRRWIVTRHAYDHWECTCGMRSRAGLAARQEVTV